MKKTDENFDNDIEVNPYDLLDALLTQPQKFYEWSRKASRASIETARAKERLDIIKSGVDLRIRRSPERFNLGDRITEKSITATIAKDKKVKRFTQKYFEALDREKTYVDAKNSFQHRKNMLEAMVQLNIQLHFADPKVVGVPAEQRGHARTRQEIKENLKKSKRWIKRR